MTIRQVISLLWLIWNIIVGLTYAWDKHLAMAGKWRIPEKRLLTMTLLAGGLGALIAAQLCHHKTTKWYFHLAWWAGIGVSVVIAYRLIRISL